MLFQRHSDRQIVQVIKWSQTLYIPNIPTSYEVMAKDLGILDFNSEFKNEVADEWFIPYLQKDKG